MAAARRYEVATQFSVTASMVNSLPIDGSAILMEDPIKGVRKEPRVATIKAARLIVLVPVLFSTSFIIYHD